MQRCEEQSIYRIMKLDHLIDLIKTNHLYVPCVNTWEDPYEGILFKSRLLIHGTEEVPEHCDITLEKYLQKVYGLSWSKRELSDGLWRSFRQTEKIEGTDTFRYIDTVKIKVSSTNLFRMLCRAPGIKAEHLFLGIIKYADDADFDRYLKKALQVLSTEGNPQYTEVVDTLLMKRKAFE